MPRPRAYNHDIRCPHCGSNWTPKDGHSRGKQTYRCKDCNYRFTPDGNRHYYPEKTIRQALAMYAEGGSISAVARAMDIHFVTVYTWVKKSEMGAEGFGHRAREASSV